MNWAQWRGDWQVLRSLVRGLPQDGHQASQLASFYGPQASHYDRFRERLLHGREEMIRALDIQAGQVVVELGAGTGRLAEFFRPQIASLRRVELVDLCEPLLVQARHRWQDCPNVVVECADARHWQAALPVDRLYLSYALSMMPDWHAVVDRAAQSLRPGGLIGVVDFHVARRTPSRRGFRQGALARHLWPLWFDRDGVRLCPDRLPYLEYRFETLRVEERRAPLPWLPGLQVPYFLFVGRRRVEENSN